QEDPLVVLGRQVPLGGRRVELRAGGVHQGHVALDVDAEVAATAVLGDRLGPVDEVGRVLLDALLLQNEGRERVVAQGVDVVGVHAAPVRLRRLHGVGVALRQGRQRHVAGGVGLAVVGQVVLVEGGGPDGAAAAGAVAVDGGDRGPAGVPRQDGHNRVGPDVEVQVLRVGDARHVSFPFRSPASGACEYYSTRNLRGFRKSLL